MSVKLSPFADRIPTTAVTTSSLSIAWESTMQLIFFRSEERLASAMEGRAWQAWRTSPVAAASREKVTLAVCCVRSLIFPD